ncbi:hypothetical protein EDC04DRAFT_2896911 [Pisolithus marmoratus]|nr:hypothetical protein EDC04DRAFT_2896911 [Pisolithus marmoratus]
MAVRELPAIDWLGYSIDLSRSPTMDLRAASASVLKGGRIIDFDISGNLRKVTINGVAYSVPGAVFISQESVVQGAFVSYATGNDAQKAFRANAGLPARYLAVTGTDAAIAVAHDRPFICENQYAFYTFTSSVYAARLRDYDDLLNEGALLRGVEGLPQQFNGNNDDVLAAYKSFFQRFGSHVIVNANYGARFQLGAWALNDNASVNAKFNTDVKAFFNGIPDGGEYDETVKSEAQYKIFLEYLQRLVTVVGGDAQLSSNLTSDPTSWNTYTQWSASVYTATPVLISFHTTAIWSLMFAFTNVVLQSYANEISQAYTWILTRPRVYKTAITFDIQSDWAEFNLLTPSAVILPDNAYPYPAGTIASHSRVQWGKEYSHDYKMQTLKFFIVNDGSPVDFSISHGSDGAGQGQGRAEALIEREQYLNDTISDNVWNTMWFFGAPVSLTPETLRLDNKPDGYSWDDILEEYLDAIAG